MSLGSVFTAILWAALSLVFPGNLSPALQTDASTPQSSAQKDAAPAPRAAKPLSEEALNRQLLVLEQRQDVLEKQLESVQEKSANLEAQAAAIRARLQNIDRERFFTGTAFVTQAEARQQVRQRLESQLPELESRKASLQEKEKRTKEQLDVVNKKLEALTQQEDDEAGAP